MSYSEECIKNPFLIEPMIKSVALTVQSETPDTKVLKVAADASEVKSTSSIGISSSSLKITFECPQMVRSRPKGSDLPGIGSGHFVQ